MSEFALKKNNFYLAPCSIAIPTKVEDFTVTLAPVKILTVSYNNDMYGRDINGYIIVKDVSARMPQQINISMYINSVSVEDLVVLNGYKSARTKLWAIDGVAEGFRENGAGGFNLMLDADKANYKYRPVIMGWNCYIENIDDGFFSSYKLADTAAITLAINGVFPSAQCVSYNLAWDGDGSLL